MLLSGAYGAVGKLGLVLSLAVLWASFFDAGVAAGSDVDIAKVRSGYRESIAKLRIIHARLEKTAEWVDAPEHLKATVSLPQGRNVLEWAIDGRRRMSAIIPGQGSHEAARRFESFDGRSRWTTDVGDGTRKDRVFQKKDEGGDEWFRLERGPGQFLGLFPDVGHSILTRSLADLLGTPQAGDPSLADLDGHRCFKVSLGPFQEVTDNSAIYWHVWFDPEFGYLPRRHEYSQELNGLASAVATVSSFRRLPEFDAWFPEVMQIDAKLFREEYRLIDVVINKPLPLDLFRPDANGMSTVNLSNPKSKDAYDREARAAIATDRVSSVAAPGQSPVKVPNHPPSSGSAWFVIAGIGLLGAALVSAYRRKRGASG